MRIFLIIFLLSLVNSCSSNVQSKWNCADPDYPDTCVTISEAEDLKFNGQTEEVADIPIYNNNYSSVKTSNTKMRRIPESIGRIWFSSFIDDDGNYHEESYVRVVDEPARWESRNVE